ADLNTRDEAQMRRKITMNYCKHLRYICVTWMGICGTRSKCSSQYCRWKLLSYIFALLDEIALRDSALAIALLRLTYLS
ncbi:hypothetical protein HAX54_000369, partial [Datura stramonium]|nr:hypothetical protein [Datura stramonium]